MSFDLDLMCFKNGEPAPFPASIARHALDPFVESRDGSFWTLAFPDGGGGELDFDDETELTGVSIGDASGEDIYSPLYDIMRQTNSVLIWSFGGCAVADARVIDDLPEDLIDDLGTPAVVRSAADIVAAVERGG